MIEAYFYGSLRKGEYNYRHFLRNFGEENFRYKGTSVLKGFKLHSLGPYPMVTKDDNSEVVVDSFSLGEEAYNSIKSMELGAGYKEEIIDGKIIYYFENNNYNAPVVESGDWVKHLKEI